MRLSKDFSWCHMIRKARVGDVKEIRNLIEIYAQKGEMLPRCLSEIYDNLRDFHVYVEEKSKLIMGVCALHICWDNLAEIKSLVVREEFWGKGIATQLVEVCLSESKALGIYKAFVLTYRVGFFKKLGFKVVDKSVLPHKIWADCIKCVRFPDCDETAMTLDM